jgi:type IV pilus assembly protein PilV
MRSLQRGVFLLEALIGILLFSFGILGLIGMQAVAIAYQSDSQYRIEAANFASRLVSQMWLNVDRTSPATIQASLAAFAHQTGGSSCNFTGAASANPLVSDWVGSITAGAGRLPGATTAMQQVIVDTTGASFNQVAVTLCWMANGNAVPKRHTFVTYIN